MNGIKNVSWKSAQRRFVAIRKARSDSDISSRSARRRRSSSAIKSDRANSETTLTPSLCLRRDGNIKLDDGKVSGAAAVNDALGSGITIHFSADVIATFFFLRRPFPSESLRLKFLPRIRKGSLSPSPSGCAPAAG